MAAGGSVAVWVSGIGLALGWYEVKGTKGELVDSGRATPTLLAAM